jgi:hypothetical protein
VKMMVAWGRTNPMATARDLAPAPAAERRKPELRWWAPCSPTTINNSITRKRKRMRRRSRCQTARDRGRHQLVALWLYRAGGNDSWVVRSLVFDARLRCGNCELIRPQKMRWAKWATCVLPFILFFFPFLFSEIYFIT